MPRKIFIHPGFAKTATTSLQDEVLSKLKNLNVIGMPNPAFDEVLDKIRHQEDIYFDTDASKKEIARLTQGTDENAPYICSCEGFTFSGFNDRRLLAKRVKDLFPDAQIIFTIRETLSLTKSLYLHELNKALGAREFVSFKRWYNRESSIKGDNLIKELDQYSVINEYVKLYGKENVHILLFEDFTKNQTKFAKEFAGITGVDQSECLNLLQSADKKNERITIAQYWLMRLYYEIFPHLLRKTLRAITPKPLRSGISNLLKKGKGISVDIPSNIEQELIANYSESNRKIADEFGIDLKSYGYK